MSSITSWTIPGAGGEPIIGDCHLPHGRPKGVVLIAHGFKGYKDYGMFPRIARAMAEAGFIAHRFNFSHSGMTNEIATFARPDLFEQDTWSRQVHDFLAVIDAVGDGVIDGRGLPYVMFGHSRGGVAALLTAGRFADDETMVQPAGLITAAAPSSCLGMSGDQAEQVMREGFVISPSSRTGQQLRIGRAFIAEQREDPAGHDLPSLVAKIRCPILIVHGETDPTVPVGCAHEIAGAAQDGHTLVIDGADHVFNVPNPLPDDAPGSPQLARMLDAMAAFAAKCCG